MKTKSFSLSVQKGFSLVELLVVIAVIAIIAAIAIPNIAGITGAANTAKSQRNAQNLASTYNAAVASGYTSTATSETTAADLVMAGINVPIGTTTNFFKVDGLSTAQRDAAVPYLDFNSTNKTLIYRDTTN